MNAVGGYTSAGYTYTVNVDSTASAVSNFSDAVAKVSDELANLSEPPKKSLVLDGLALTNYMVRSTGIGAVAADIVSVRRGDELFYPAPARLYYGLLVESVAQLAGMTNEDVAQNAGVQSTKHAELLKAKLLEKMSWEIAHRIPASELMPGIHMLDDGFLLVGNVGRVDEALTKEQQLRRALRVSGMRPFRVGDEAMVMFRETTIAGNVRAVRLGSFRNGENVKARRPLIIALDSTSSMRSVLEELVITTKTKFAPGSIGAVYIVLIADYGEPYVWQKLGPVDIESLPEIGLKGDHLTAGGLAPEAYGAGFFGVTQVLEELGGMASDAQVLFAYDSHARDDNKYDWADQLKIILGHGAEFIPMWCGDDLFGSARRPFSEKLGYILGKEIVDSSTDLVNPEFMKRPWKDVLEDLNGNGTAAFPCHWIPSQMYTKYRATKKTTTEKAAEALGVPMGQVIARYLGKKRAPDLPAFVYTDSGLFMALRAELAKGVTYYKAYNSPKTLVGGERFAVLERTPDSMVMDYAGVEK
jgi:hypothetical protein